MRPDRPQPTPTTNPGRLAGVFAFLGTIVVILLVAAVPVLPGWALGVLFVGGVVGAWLADRRWG